MKLKIARSAYALILAEMERTPDEESCGLLIGHEGRVETAVPAANVAADKGRFFEIDPHLLLSEHRKARSSGRKVIGNYHTHPGGRPSPSLRDAANAYEQGAIWLIAGNGGALGAFQAIRGGEIAGRFDPVEWEVE